jgi:hypothetical protein
VGGYKTATKRLSSLTVLFNWDDGNTLEERERGGIMATIVKELACGIRVEPVWGGGRGSWGA